MKALTTKELVSLAVIAITAPVLALGVVLAAGVMVSAGNGPLLLALTLCGAVVSGDEWFWPPHGQGRIPIAQQPRRATVKRGPHIMSAS